MRVVITANGLGERMKGLSPKPKHMLYYGNRRIVDRILGIFPNAEVLENIPSNNRRETLKYIQDYTDCLIIDCDVIPRGCLYQHNEDTVYYFVSDKEKYSSISIHSGRVSQASEHGNISEYKCSGAYYVKSVSKLIEKMGDNSIVEGMIGANVRQENSFVRLGDIEDYYDSIGRL